MTDNCPKCLLEIGGRTLLTRTIDALCATGVRDITIVTGYRSPMIVEHVRSLCRVGVRFNFIENTLYQTTNNIYSLWLAGPSVAGKDFILMDSDIYCDAALVARTAGQDGNVLAVNRHELGDEEVKVICDDGGVVLEISKTCDAHKACGESVGVEKMTSAYSAALFRELDLMCGTEGLIDVFYEAAFERLIPLGHSFRVLDTTDFFSMELDTVEDFEQARMLSHNQCAD